MSSMASSSVRGSRTEGFQGMILDGGLAVTHDGQRGSAVVMASGTWPDERKEPPWIHISTPF